MHQPSKSSPLADFFGLKSPFCGPSDKTGAVPAVTASTVPGPQASFSFPEIHPSLPAIAQALSSSNVFADLASSSVCGPSDKTGAVPAMTAPTVPGPRGRIRPLLLVHFKCPEFGINSESLRLGDWPRYQRLMGKRRIISVQLFGSLV